MEEGTYFLTIRCFFVCMCLFTRKTSTSQILSLCLLELVEGLVIELSFLTIQFLANISNKSKIMIQINPSCITQALMFHNILFVSNKSTCQNLLLCSDKVTHFPSGIQSSDANRNLQSGQSIN